MFSFCPFPLVCIPEAAATVAVVDWVGGIGDRKVQLEYCFESKSFAPSDDILTLQR